MKKTLLPVDHVRCKVTYMPIVYMHETTEIL